ncbi:MAG: translation initiation factor IF-3 [Candidatus Omnitrophica bacterium]|nr:translation initiation factor IF-3 [Candidatus Omnitrophota bacterium]
MRRWFIIQKRIRINEQIRVLEVRLIGPEAEQLGVMTIAKAQELSDQYGLDLVEVAPTAKPPVCRIMDFSKFKYEQEKKERRAKKNAHVVHLKQIRIKPHIEEHDLETKLNQAKAFLEKKDKVRVNLFFSGREMAFRDKARGLLEKFIVETAELAQVEKDIMMEGRVMSVLISPKADKV